MSQRSQTNDRYRKDAEIGSTRRSAASVRPVRKAGTVEVGSGQATKSSKAGKGRKAAGRAGTSSATHTKAAKGAKAARGARPKSEPVKLPTSPEIKKWRTVWWVLLGCAFVLLISGWFVPVLRTSATANTIVTAAVFLLCAADLYIDLVVIRKLRNKLIEEQKRGKKSPTTAKKSAPAGGKTAPAEKTDTPHHAAAGLFKKKE